MASPDLAGPRGTAVVIKPSALRSHRPWGFRVAGSVGCVPEGPVFGAKAPLGTSAPGNVLCDRCAHKAELHMRRAYAMPKWCHAEAGLCEITW